MAKTTKKKILKLRNIKQELFCNLYAGPGETFNNATMSYAVAYDYISKRNNIKEKLKGEINERKRIDLKVELTRIENVCAVQGNRLLRNIKIRSRCDAILDARISHDVVDRETMKVITQDKDLNAKMRAVTEYNKVRNRVKEAPFEGKIIMKWED
jgi:hypothetical protein